MSNTVTRTCNLCEAMCGLLVTVDGGRVTDLRGDPDDVLSRGHICPKAPALRELHEDPDRLRAPVRRTASGWERVGWDAALDEAAARIAAVRERYGPDAVAFYVGNPTVHNHGLLTTYLPFIGALGSRTRFDANSVDANPKLLACLQMYGELTSIPVPDIDRTDFLLIVGANPLASHGSLMSLGDPRGRLDAVRERGGRVVVIDPRRTETAARAGEHHFIRPGADAAFLLALLHVLYAEAFVDDAWVAAIANGGAELRELAARFPPERVAAAVGMSAETIGALARDFGAARRAVIYGRVGTTLNEHGTLASWLLEVINVVTGNFDREGGAMFTTPAVDLAAFGRRLDMNGYARWHSRVSGRPELGGMLPIATLAEEIETPGPGQVRALITVAGNPVLSTPNSARLGRALSRLDVMVSLDLYVNESTRHAHLVLPPRGTLERSHYDLVLSALAVRNVAKYTEPTLPEDGDGRHDWEILYDLGMRLGGLRFGSRPFDLAARAAWRATGWRLSPDRILDGLLRTGPHGDRFLPFGKGLSLKKLRRAPHGVDLGPLVPSRHRAVRTRSGKVELAPRIFLDDVPRLERWLDGQRGGLVLIGRRHARSNNSWMHNVRSLTKGPSRAGLLIHPEDAARLGLASGQSVRVSTRVGEVRARVEPTDDIMRGVVSLPHGYGHAAAADTLTVAGALEGPNVNALADETWLEPLSGTAILNGFPVTVEPVTTP